MGRDYVDTYMKNLPLYWMRAKTIRAEKTYQATRNYFYKELIKDFDYERKGRKIPETINGDPLTWKFIDFNPYEAWLGRQTKPLQELRVETWECRSDTWNPHFKEEDRY